MPPGSKFITSQGQGSQSQKGRGKSDSRTPWSKFKFSVNAKCYGTVGGGDHFNDR